MTLNERVILVLAPFVIYGIIGTYYNVFTEYNSMALGITSGLSLGSIYYLAKYWNVKYPQ